MLLRHGGGGFSGADKGPQKRKTFVLSCWLVGVFNECLSWAAHCACDILPCVSCVALRSSENGLFVISKRNRWCLFWSCLFAALFSLAAVTVTEFCSFYCHFQHHLHFYLCFLPIICFHILSVNSPEMKSLPFACACSPFSYKRCKNMSFIEIVPLLCSDCLVFSLIQKCGQMLKS